MKKTYAYIVAAIIVLTFGAIVYLVFKANQLEQYTMAVGINISPQMGSDNYIHIVGKLISCLFNLLVK